MSFAEDEGHDAYGVLDIEDLEETNNFNNKKMDIEKDVCPECGSPIKIVPEGISKAGKPYKPFYACTKWECKWTAKIGEEVKPTAWAKAEKQVQNNVSSNIEKHEARKENSMTTLAINRDATLITVACLNGSPMLMAKEEERREFIKQELKFWKEHLTNSVYNLPF